MQTPVFTGCIDEEGNAVYVGDILSSEYGYAVTVCYDEEDNSFYGSLNCEIGHSCRNIQYDLNSGHGYTKVYGCETSENNEE